ncbi:hypothetical protein DY000_02035328 [Brassica cretica]|uniref:Protein kinase domain-containing protein n=1 Tax=Brassica cretica TaxID=69181 RepID=A0ABQ7DMR5_BRACR|nr:hypothetical protein DY000_02035328 [Brassica cretica]
MMGVCLMNRWLLFITFLCALTNVNEALSPDEVEFPEDPDPCNWKGVTCDSQTKRVIALGPLPPELGKLDQLRILMLHNNALYGSIPAALRNCTALEGIYLQNNYLSGTIPSEMGNLSALKDLYAVFLLLKQCCGGFGTVYKLDMEDGNVFALKKIVKLNEGFDRFFERELEILGSIKHRYLVNLRGYCNSPTSKLLLYDYLPGGSLDEALHEGGEQLDWDSRVNIIIGAAKGLAYLHHDCSPRITHRDIKSSNILLDGNLEARVSDFGLAKLLEDEESHITNIVAGTFGGNLAPDNSIETDFLFLFFHRCTRTSVQQRLQCIQAIQELQEEIKLLQIPNEKLNGEGLNGLSYSELSSIENMLNQGLVIVEEQTDKVVPMMTSVDVDERVMQWLWIDTVGKLDVSLFFCFLKNRHSITEQLESMRYEGEILEVVLSNDWQ